MSQYRLELSNLLKQHKGSIIEKIEIENLKMKYGVIDSEGKIKRK